MWVCSGVHATVHRVLWRTFYYQRAHLHRSQGLLKFSVRLNRMSLTSHIVTAKWSTRKLLLARVVPLVWVICCLSNRPSLGHSGWVFFNLTQYQEKRRLRLIFTQNKQTEHISKSCCALCIYFCLHWFWECCEMLYYQRNIKDEANIIYFHPLLVFLKKLFY